MADRAERIHFGSIKEAIEPPNLIEVQLNSYVDFLQKDVPFAKRKAYGLQAVFTEVFPIESYDGKSCSISSYEIGEPKLIGSKCLREGLTYGAPLYVTFLLQGRKGHEGRKSFHGRIAADDAARHVRHQRRRARHRSQLHRSPGSAFEATQHPERQDALPFRIIPDRGSWYEAQFDTSDLLYVYLDRRKRRRKFLTTTFLRALGYGYGRRDPQAFLRRSKRLKLSEKLDEERLATKVLIADVPTAKVTVVARAFEPLSKATFARSWRSASRIQGRRYHVDDGIVIKCAEEGSGQERRRSAQGYLSPPASWGSADRGERARFDQASVLRSEELRSRSRWPLQDQPEARHQRRATSAF